MHRLLRYIVFVLLSGNVYERSTLKIMAATSTVEWQTQAVKIDELLHSSGKYTYFAYENFVLSPSFSATY